MLMCVHVPVFCIPVWLGSAGTILFVHLVFPKDEIAYKKMQNSFMLKLFPNVINHIGANLSFQNKCCSTIYCCSKGHLGGREM